MKLKTTLLLALLFGANIICSAQNTPTPKQEVSISAGAASIPWMALKISGTLINFFTLDHMDVSDMSDPGAFTLEYTRHTASKHLAYGASLSVENAHINCRIKNKKDENGISMYGDPFPTNMLFASAMAMGKLIWFDKEHVSMYTKGALGLCLIDPSAKLLNSTVTLAFQVSPVCLEVGSQQFRGFAELGLGVQGLIQGGVKYSF